MSDNTYNIPLTPLVKKDEQGNPTGNPIIPQLLVVGRGEAEGNVYPSIVVTKENFKDYVNLRGIDSVLDALNSKERLDAQAALDHVLSDEDWEEVEGAKDKEGKAVKRFTYVVDKFKAVIEKFYETLLSGKVRGGVTITDLVEQQAELFAEMQKKISEMIKAAPDRAREMMIEANSLNIKHQELSAQIAEIKAARKPRMTKAEKLAALAAAKAAQGAGQQQVAA